MLSLEVFSLAPLFSDYESALFLVRLSVSFQIFPEETLQAASLDTVAHIVVRRFGSILMFSLVLL